MELVRDLIDSRVTFYWREEIKRLSPLFKSLEDARTWRLQRQFETYEGIERRASAQDRRRDEETSQKLTQSMGLARPNPVGRRSTDRFEVRINVDLYKAKAQPISLAS